MEHDKICRNCRFYGSSTPSAPSGWCDNEEFPERSGTWGSGPLPDADFGCVLFQLNTARDAKQGEGER